MKSIFFQHNFDIILLLFSEACLLLLLKLLLHLRQWQKDKNKRRLTEHETLQLVYSEHKTLTGTNIFTCDW